MGRYMGVTWLGFAPFTLAEAPLTLAIVLPHLVCGHEFAVFSGV